MQKQSKPEQKCKNIFALKRWFFQMCVQNYSMMEKLFCIHMSPDTMFGGVTFS